MKILTYILLILPFIVGCSNEKSVKEPLSSQDQFSQIIKLYKKKYIKQRKSANYLDKKKDLKRIYNHRTKKLRVLLKDGKVKHWKGKVEDICSYSEKGAWLKVSINRHCTLGYQDNLLIHKNTPLYQKLRRIKEGQVIEFDGEFLVPENDQELEYPYKAYYAEESFTDYGCMTDPYFLFRFTDIHN